MNQRPPTSQDPLFILAPHRSFTSVVCMMLGQHPEMYGLPETNLFATGTIGGWWLRYRGGRAPGGHGLLRAVAELRFGSQSDATVRLARAWLRERLDWDGTAVLRALADMVAPLMLVEKSPGTASSVDTLQHLRAVFPRARFLHLLRHPRAQGESMLQALVDIGVPADELQAWLRQGGDPQEWWYLSNENICSFLGDVPQSQKMRLRGEDLMADVDTHLGTIATWLGLRCDAEATESMKHPEQSPFAGFGPAGARLGNDPHLLEHPALREPGSHPPKRTERISWYRSQNGIAPKVKRLAAQFGYD